MADHIPRAHPRYPVGWRATFRCTTWEIAARVAVANVSRRGMFLRTKRPPETGTRVELTLELPDGGSLRLEGVVRYAVEEGSPDGRDAGAGVELDASHDADLQRLEQAARNESLPPDDAAAAAAASIARITLSMPAIEPVPVPALPPPLPIESATSYSMHKRRRR